MASVNDVKKQVATRNIRPMSPAVAEVRNNINIMVEVMKSCMVQNMHYGTIPGVQKPSLFKAGAEKIMATFRLSADPVVEDLSKDGEIRFRVKVEIKAKDGSFVGAGIGECSSQEEKYMWRAAVCDEEFDITPEDKRRIKFKKNYGKIEKVQQIRCNPSDLANTILKMAKKRALVDGVLTATGASDLFSQDIEDLPPEYVHQEPIKNAEVVEPKQPEQPKQAELPPAKEEIANEFYTEGETVQEEKSDSFSLIDVPVGETASEIDLFVRDVEFKESIGKNGRSTIRCEDSEKQTYYIYKWGQIKEEIKGNFCTFFLVKVSDYQGKRQYMADKVVVKK